MELQGTIKMIDETKTYGSNGFRKREMVVTTQEQYPQHISQFNGFADSVQILKNRGLLFEAAKTEKSETTTEPAASVGEEEIPSVEQAKDEAPVLEADQEQVSDDKDTDTGSEKK